MNRKMIDDRLVLTLNGTVSEDELRAARDRKGEKYVTMDMMGAFVNFCGAQEPIADFGGKLNLQICEVIEASTQGGDVKVTAKLLCDACPEAGEALIKVMKGEDPEASIYTKTALIGGTIISFYYRPDKHWGTVYRVVNDLLPNGEQILVPSNEYPVPEESDIVCFFVSGVHATRSVEELINIERSANGLEPLEARADADEEPAVVTVSPEVKGSTSK